MNARGASIRGGLRPPDVYIGLVLTLITLVAFWPVLENGFVSYDDPGYVTDNPRVRSGLSTDGVAWAFTTGAQGNWHPLTWLSHMLDVTLFGLEPRGHYLSSLALHLASVLLLFVFLRRATGQPYASGFVAALFAVHPLRVESVAWVAERKDVLSTLFLMLTLLAYHGYARRPGGGRYLLVVGLFALGLLSKPMLVTLPFLLLLLDFWPLNRVPADWAPLPSVESAFPRLERVSWRRLLAEKVPLLALAAVSSTVTFAVQRSGLAVKSLEQFPLASRVANAALAYVEYVRKMLWPDDLAFLYPFPSSFSTFEVIAAAAGLVLMSFAAIRFARRAPYVFVGWFWYVGMLVPVIGLVQVGGQSMADRYTYVPLVGLFVLLTWAARELLDGWSRRSLALGLAGAMIIALLLPVTRAQVRFRRDSRTLFERALAVTEGNYVAHDLLGVEMLRQGRLEDAIDQYSRALEIAPGYAFSRNNLGVALAETGRFVQAEAEYRQALEKSPAYAEAHNNLGITLVNLGRTEEALDHFEAALRADPDDPEIHHNLALALSMRGNAARAVHHYRRALELEPEWHSVALAAAWILATHPDPASRDGREAVRLAEGACKSLGRRDPRNLDTLAAAYAEAGRFDDAVRTADLAVERAAARRDPALARRLSARAEIYRSGRPYRGPR